MKLLPSAIRCLCTVSVVPIVLVLAQIFHPRLNECLTRATGRNEQNEKLFFLLFIRWFSDAIFSLTRAICSHIKMATTFLCSKMFCFKRNFASSLSNVSLELYSIAPSSITFIPVVEQRNIKKNLQKYKTSSSKHENGSRASCEKFLLLERENKLQV